MQNYHIGGIGNPAFLREERWKGTAMRIELLYFEDCPNHKEAEALLAGVLREHGITDPITRVAIESDEDARRHRFPGSPTIRVNGEDVEPSAGGQVTGRTCRVYRVDGKYTGLPTREMIRNALGVT